MKIDVSKLGLENLGKGDQIGVTTIERASGTDRRRPNFKLAMLAVKKAAEEFFDNTGNPVSIKADGDSLLILTDEQAAKYQRGRFVGHVRGLRRAVVKQSQVDEDNIQSEEELERHRKALARNQRISERVSQMMRQKKLQQEYMERMGMTPTAAD